MFTVSNKRGGIYMLRSGLQNDKLGEYRQMLDTVSTELRVAAVGIIQSYNPATVTATIQLTGIEAFRQTSGEYGESALPLLLDVPVVFPHSQNFVITFPIKPGDECLVVFCDRCFDAWYQSGGVQKQVEARSHDLSDAIAIVGPYSQPVVPPEVDGENLVIRTFDNVNYIRITPDGNMKVYMSQNIVIESGTDIALIAPHIGEND